MGERELEQVEGILRDASGWSPETPAPEGLITRALQEHLTGTRGPVLNSAGPVHSLLSRRLARSGGWAIAACCALWMAFPTWFSLTPLQPVEDSQPTFAHSPVHRVPAATLVSSASPVPEKETARPIEDGSEFSRSAPPEIRRGVRKGSRKRPRKLVPPRLAPSAQWKVEYVNHETTRVLTPGWLVAPDRESGTLYAHPGVIAVPLVNREGAGRAGGELPPTFDPDFIVDR